MLGDDLLSFTEPSSFKESLEVFRLGLQSRRADSKGVQRDVQISISMLYLQHQIAILDRNVCYTAWLSIFLSLWLRRGVDTVHGVEVYG